MQIFIVTRFSLRLFTKWEEGIGLREETRAEWFEYRAEIFNKITLPCIMKQSTDISRHFICMDHSDKHLYDLHIEKPNFLQPIFSCKNELNEILTSELSKVAVGPLIVAGIDSDDLVSSTYFQQLMKCAHSPKAQARAAKEGKVIFKARNGYNTDLKFIQNYFDNSPSFLATYYPIFVAPLDLGGNHMFINDRNPLPCDSAIWARFIHDSNVINYFKPWKVSRVSEQTWPREIPMPDGELTVKSSFTYRGRKRNDIKGKLRLFLLSLPYGYMVFRGGTYALMVARYFKRTAEKVRHLLPVLFTGVC